MKAVILARVSTKEQEEGHSLDAQIMLLKEYCLKKDLEIIKEFKIVESSTRGERKDFKKILKFIDASKEPIALVCHKVDRLQRSFNEYHLLNAPLSKGMLELHFTQNNSVMSQTSGSNDKLVWNMQIMLAQNFTDSISDNVRRSFVKKIADGTILGVAPLGYLNTKDKNGKNTVIVDPKRGLFVKKIFEEYSTGVFSLNEILQKAKDWHLTSVKGFQLYKSSIYHIINNPFYYGQMRYYDKLHNHIYEKLITKELFDKCQRVLRGRTTQQSRKEGHGAIPYIFRGLISCADCGCTISTDRKIKKSGKEYHYLYCSKARGECSTGRINENKAVEQIENVFEGMVLPDKVVKEMKEHIKTTLDSKQDFQNHQLDLIQSKYKKTFEKEKNLFQMKVEGYNISKTKYDSSLSDIKNERSDLKEQLKNLETADKQFYVTIELLLELSQNAGKIFKSSEIEQKRRLINIVFKNLELKDTSLCFSLKKPFDMFLKIGGGSKWLGW